MQGYFFHSIHISENQIENLSKQFSQILKIPTLASNLHVIFRVEFQSFMHNFIINKDEFLNHK